MLIKGLDRRVVQVVVVNVFDAIHLKRSSHGNAKSICATKLKGHGRGACSFQNFGQTGLASKAKASRQGDRACHRACSPLSARLRPLRRDQVRGPWRVARRPPAEEITLRALPERAQLPTLRVLATSAAFHGRRCVDHAEFLWQRRQPCG